MWIYAPQGDQVVEGACRLAVHPLPTQSLREAVEHGLVTCRARMPITNKVLLDSQQQYDHKVL